MLSICKKSGPYLGIPPRLRPGEHRAGSPAPHPTAEAGPRHRGRPGARDFAGKSVQMVIGRRGVGPFRYGGGGRLRATAPQSRRPRPRPLTTLNRVCVCVWPLPLPSPPTHTFFTSYWPRSASLLVLMLTMLTVIGIIHSITVPRLNIYLYV